MYIEFSGFSLSLSLFPPYMYAYIDICIYIYDIYTHISEHICDIYT